MRSRRYWPACGGRNRPAPRAAVHNGTGRAVRGRYVQAWSGVGAARPSFPANPAGGPNCVVETGVRDALPPLRWGAGFSRSGSGIPLITYLALASHVLPENVVMAGKRELYVGRRAPSAD